MFTQEQLKQQLRLISKIGSRTENPGVVHFDFDTNDKFKAQVVCYLSCRFTNKYYEWYTKEWINKFSMFTDTPWVSVRKSSQKNAIYIKIYKCHTVRQPTCKSRIVFKVIGDEHGSNKMIITINYLKCTCLVSQELLPVEAKQSLSDCNKECKPLSNIHQTFYTYFSDSFTPMTAKMYHSLILLVNKGNVLSDQNMSPTMSDVMLFWHTWKFQLAEKFYEDKFIKMVKIMERKITEMDAMGVFMRTQDQEIVIVITPTMKRVLMFHELNVVIVSSTPVPRGPQASFFFVPSKIGALCFACVLHQKQTLEAYKQIFLTIKATIENDFKKTFKPRSIVIPDSQDQLLAIKAVFDNSKVMIAPWSLCRDLWTYMCLEKTLDAACHTTMAAFHEIMHAADAKSAHLRFIKFTTSEEFTNLTKPLKKHLQEVWKKNRLIVWWSSANNSLIELSITLLQQLIIEKCDSFNIVNMCDVISTLDIHFQEFMMRWVSNKSIFKTYTKFLNKLSPKLNTWTIKLTLPHQFLFTKGNSQIMVRTDTWLCSCSLGKRTLYCEHLCAVMELADVTVTLTDDERDLLKLIAGENNVNTEYIEDNSHTDNVHPPYSDGYYVFHFPIEIISQNSEDNETLEKESDDIVITKKLENDTVIKKNLENTTDVYKENIYLFADPDPKENLNKEESLNFTNFTGLGLQETIKAEQMDEIEVERERPFYVKDEPMEIDYTDMPNYFDAQEINLQSKTIYPIKKEITEEFVNIESTDIEDTDLFKYKNLQDNKHTTDASEYIMKPKIEKTLFIEIDIDMNKEVTQKNAISNEDSDENMTEINTQNLGNNNLLEEYMSQNFAVSENNFEAEYKDAVARLCAEFQSLDDCLSQSPSASKLASIVRLTNELSRASMELLDIKPEHEDSNN